MSGVTIVLVKTLENVPFLDRHKKDNVVGVGSVRQSIFVWSVTAEK